VNTDESLATSSLNLPCRCMAVGLVDPPSNPDMNPRNELMEITCNFVRELPIFALNMKLTQ
jgi:hypothetical protein